MNETARLLFANDAFYLIFRSRDVAGMDALWASEAGVSCIHPGWDILDNREDVMASWRGILGNAASPPVESRGARARVSGGMGLVMCYEIVEGSTLVATNVFVKEGADWKMVHHQAGPCRVSPEKLGEEPTPTSVQ
jgi:SnoaL-like domain